MTLFVFGKFMIDLRVLAVSQLWGLTTPERTLSVPET